MTFTTDTAGHPDVTEISDLTEGLLPPSRAEELLRHLDECSSCADVHESLEEIRGLLETSAEPLEMPRDVAERIDAALAAERVGGTAIDRAGNDDGDGHHALVSRETPLADRPAGRARTDGTGPGRKTRTRRGRRRVAVLGTALTVAALGVASVVLTSLHDDKGSDATAHGRPSASADTFSEATLKNRVTNLLDKTQTVQGTTHAPHSFGADSDQGSDKPNILKSAPTVSVPSCVLGGLGSSTTPLAAEAGTYNGKDAYLLVLPDAPGSSAHVTAYVVDATCVHRPSAAAKVLLSHSYTRS
ncbi:anti-sigma factor [Streptomyces sp. MK5]|uniref:anti-sigma factor family protein n=1 Tax=Streptomyces sp. MK5 TaxID=3064253 RepID=UPI0027418DED|nr:zf-HC2 domain-containing protein [Streptomyces sp. MK5]